MLIFSGGIGLPGGLSLFDSAAAIFDSADSGDEELVEIVRELNEGSSPDSVRERLVDAVQESRQLVLRAIQIAPITTSEASNLQRRADDADLESLLDDDSKEAMMEKVKKLDRQQQATIRFLFSRCASNHQFVRDFLARGHTQLPEPLSETEEIATKRIEAMRTLNRVLAKRVASVDLEDEENASKTPPTQDQIDARIERVYGPATDSVNETKELFLKLAEQQYKLKEKNASSLKPYTEPMHYANQAQSHVFFGAMGLQKSESEFVKSFSAMRLAATEIDRAMRGTPPSHLAAAEQEKEAAAQRERERQERIAAAEREREKTLANQRAAAEKSASQPSQSNPNDLAATEPMTDPGRKTQARPDDRPPFGSRFSPPLGGPMRGGPMPRGMGPNGPSQGDGQRGDLQSGGGQPNRGATFGPGRMGGSNTRPRPPVFDPKTGVTIKMQNAGNLGSSEVMKKFRSLKSATSVRIRNGEMTVQIGYTGDLDDVAELIDFGTIQSSDDSSRTIIVEKQ